LRGPFHIRISMKAQGCDVGPLKYAPPARALLRAERRRPAAFATTASIPLTSPPYPPPPYHHPKTSAVASSSRCPVFRLVIRGSSNVHRSVDNGPALRPRPPRFRTARPRRLIARRPSSTLPASGPLPVACLSAPRRRSVLPGQDEALIELYSTGCSPTFRGRSSTASSEPASSRPTCLSSTMSSRPWSSTDLSSAPWRFSAEAFTLVPPE